MADPEAMFTNPMPYFLASYKILNVVHFPIPPPAYFPLRQDLPFDYSSRTFLPKDGSIESVSSDLHVGAEINRMQEQLIDFLPSKIFPTRHHLALPPSIFISDRTIYAHENVV